MMQIVEDEEIEGVTKKVIFFIPIFSLFISTIIWLSSGFLPVFIVFFNPIYWRNDLILTLGACVIIVLYWVTGRNLYNSYQENELKYEIRFKERIFVFIIGSIGLKVFILYQTWLNAQRQLKQLGNGLYQDQISIEIGIGFYCILLSIMILIGIILYLRMANRIRDQFVPYKYYC